MSVCQQAIRNRRKARLDERYRSTKGRDATASRRRLLLQIERERRIKQGAGKKS